MTLEEIVAISNAIEPGACPGTFIEPDFRWSPLVGAQMTQFCEVVNESLLNCRDGKTGHRVATLIRLRHQLV